MTMTSSLNDLGILVLRPIHQAKGLCTLIEREGGKAVQFPTMDIVPATDKEALDGIIKNLNQFDIAIFISPNAVNYGIEVIKQHWPEIPQHLVFAGVGQSTATELEKKGLMISICPQLGSGSEALLAEPALQDVMSQKIVIFSGVGGRDMLEQTLRLRGASVAIAQCYERHCPNVSPEPLLAKWRQNEIDIIVSTSIQGLKNLRTMIGDPGKRLLQSTVLLVISQRMADYAQQHQLSCDIIVAESAQDSAVVERLIEWNEGNSSV